METGKWKLELHYWATVPLRRVDEAVEARLRFCGFVHRTSFSVRELWLVVQAERHRYGVVTKLMPATEIQP